MCSIKNVISLLNTSSRNLVHLCQGTTDKNMTILLAILNEM